MFKCPNHKCNIRNRHRWCQCSSGATGGESCPARQHPTRWSSSSCTRQSQRWIRWWGSSSPPAFHSTKLKNAVSAGLYTCLASLLHVRELVVFNHLLETVFSVLELKIFICIYIYIMWFVSIRTLEQVQHPWTLNNKSQNPIPSSETYSLTSFAHHAFPLNAQPWTLSP